MPIPATDERQDVSIPMHRTPGRPDAIKPAAGAGRGRNAGGRGRSGGGGGGGQRAPQQANRPRTDAKAAAPRGDGGNAPVRRPAAASAATPATSRDRAWRDGDFRDAAPSFLRKR